MKSTATPTLTVSTLAPPNSFHKRDCLAAIAAGKNVLCEKPFTVNVAETKEVLDAAKAKGVYVAEAMWLRHRPMVADLTKLLYEGKVIGDVFRTTSEFKMYLDIANLPMNSRYKDPHMDAGSLLDIGIYALTWAIVMLEPGTPTKPETPNIMAAQSFIDGIEVTTSAILHYKNSSCQATVASTTNQGTEDTPNVVVAIIDARVFRGRSVAYITHYAYC